MVITSISQLVHAVTPFIPPGLVLSVSSAFINEGKYLSAYRHEFIGTLLMISCTFSAGKWIGVSSTTAAWGSHAVGVVAADYVGGGPQVNPAVSLSMWALGKVNYTEMFVRIAAQMGGGLVAFPLFHLLSETLEWTPLGGPEYDPSEDEHAAAAFFSEFAASFLLMWLIYVLNWELHFGKYHYWIKQPLTALGIRYLIEVFPTAGPAMNPMLGTSWAVFASDDGTTFPHEAGHYFVYWMAPFAAALAASFLYVVYAGGTMFGYTVPFGPVKEQKAASSPTETTESKKKKGPTKKE